MDPLSEKTRKTLDAFLLRTSKMDDDKRFFALQSRILKAYVQNDPIFVPLMRLLHPERDPILSSPGLICQEIRNKKSEHRSGLIKALLDDFEQHRDEYKYNLPCVVYRELLSPRAEPKAKKHFGVSFDELEEMSFQALYRESLRSPRPVRTEEEKFISGHLRTMLKLHPERFDEALSIMYSVRHETSLALGITQDFASQPEKVSEFLKRDWPAKLLVQEIVLLSEGDRQLSTTLPKTLEKSWVLLGEALKSKIDDLDEKALEFLAIASLSSDVSLGLPLPPLSKRAKIHTLLKLMDERVFDEETLGLHADWDSASCIDCSMFDLSHRLTNDDLKNRAASFRKKLIPFLEEKCPEAADFYFSRRGHSISDHLPSNQKVIQEVLPLLPQSFLVKITESCLTNLSQNHAQKSLKKVLSFFEPETFIKVSLRDAPQEGQELWQLVMAKKTKKGLKKAIPKKKSTGLGRRM